MNTSLLSVIIVNYNGAPYLKNCLLSIENKCRGFNYEIIVVDNNSTDNSIDIIESNFDNIDLIKREQNIGFAAGNNLGVKRSKGEYILLLNNDTILLDALSPAIELMKNNKQIGIVGIKMLDGNNTFTPSFGKFPRYYNFLKLKTLQINLDNIHKKIGQNKSFDVDWISGAFLLTTKDIWIQVKGLDEDYFMYVEDVDFNKKVKDLGKRSVLLPTLKFTHFVGFNKSREKLLINSYMIYIRKHKRGVDKWLSLFLLNLNLFYKKAFKKI